MTLLMVKKQYTVDGKTRFSYNDSLSSSMIVLKTVFERSVFDIRKIQAALKDSKLEKKIFEYQRL